MRKSTREQQITIRLSDEELNYCDKQNLSYGSRSNYIRHLIKEDMRPLQLQSEIASPIIDQETFTDKIKQALLSLTPSEKRIFLSDIISETTTVEHETNKHTHEPLSSEIKPILRPSTEKVDEPATTEEEIPEEYKNVSFNF